MDGDTSVPGPDNSTETPGSDYGFIHLIGAGSVGHHQPYARLPEWLSNPASNSPWDEGILCISQVLSTLQQ